MDLPFFKLNFTIKTLSILSINKLLISKYSYCFLCLLLWMIGPVAGDIVTGGFSGEGDYVVAASAVATRQGFGLITCCAIFTSLQALLLLL